MVPNSGHKMNDNNFKTAVGDWLSDSDKAITI